MKKKRTRVTLKKDRESYSRGSPLLFTCAGGSPNNI
jgi:hypothetical protein